MAPKATCRSLLREAPHLPPFDLAGKSVSRNHLQAAGPPAKQGDRQEWERSRWLLIKTFARRARPAESPAEKDTGPRTGRSGILARVAGLADNAFRHALLRGFTRRTGALWQDLQVILVIRFLAGPAPSKNVMPLAIRFRKRSAAGESTPRE